MAGSPNFKVPFIKPMFPSASELLEDYEAILKANWYTNFGQYERKFAKALAGYIGPDYHAATFSSATTALFAAIIAALGLGDGTKYIPLPSFTFAAGADAIIWCGYKPVFVDIEDHGFHMDLDQAASLLEDSLYKGQVAAILFCNAFGSGTGQIAGWEQLAKKHNLPLIIDSAAGFGSSYPDGSKVGSAGTCEIFSFHATKPFSIGEGGAVTTKDQSLADATMAVSNFGFEKRSAQTLGFNGKLQEINAAIGLRQLAHFEHKLEGRRAVYARYVRDLDPRKYSFQENAETASLCFAPVRVKDGVNRDAVLEKLHLAGVGAETYYSPSLHSQPYFKDTAVYGSLSVTEKVGSQILSLPIHDNMDETDITLIVDTLNE